MASRNTDLDAWEHEARRLLSPLAREQPQANPMLSEAAMNRVYASMTIGDILEFSTSVLVREHLCSSVELLACVLGTKNGRTPNHD